MGDELVDERAEVWAQRSDQCKTAVRTTPYIMIGEGVGLCLVDITLSTHTNRSSKYSGTCPSAAYPLPFLANVLGWKWLPPKHAKTLMHEAMARPKWLIFFVRFGQDRAQETQTATQNAQCKKQPN